MPSRKEMAKLAHLAKIVRERKKILRQELILASGFSISYCEKLLPYLPVLFTDIIYDKSTNMYEATETEEVNS